MSLTVNTEEGFKKTTTFIFSTTLVGDSVLDFGDGSFTEINPSTSVEHIYSDYGIYTARITDCENNVGQELQIIVNPHISDSVTILEYPEEEQVGKESEIFFVEVTSNCPPPIQIKLSALNSTTPFAHKIKEDWLKDVTPKKYFETEKDIQDNVITLGDEDLSEYYVGDEVCGYKGYFCFSYYDDWEGDVEIQVEMVRSCDLCSPQLKYNS